MTTHRTAYHSLQDFIKVLEKENELVRIKNFVSPKLEIAEITDRILKKNGPALLFENNGTAFPLLINAFGSEKRMCLALGVDNLDQIGKEIENLFKSFSKLPDSFLEKLKLLPLLRDMNAWFPKVVIKGKALCQQNILHSPDLSKLPILTCWPEDGGPFITLPVVHTKDAITGIRNVGMYRMQVFSDNETGMHWHLHKGSAKHYEHYKKLGKKMPVSVILGGDPVYTYVATAPLPDNLDEYIFAGYLRKKKVELVKCITNDLEVPADADFVIEGYVDPSEEKILEGPFGDHTGYYSLADYYPKFHVTCITHRNDAVYPATIVGIPPQEDAWIGKATERIFLTPIRMTMLPEIVDMHMPIEGVFHNIAILSIKKEYPGHAQKVMNCLWGAGQMMFNKFMIVVDEHVDVNDYNKIAESILKNVNVNSDLHFSQGPLDVLDHSASSFAFGSKMGIDATRKLSEEIFNKDNQTEFFIQDEKLKKQFSEIKDINKNLSEKEIPILLISFDKIKKNHAYDLHESIVKSMMIEGVKFIFYFDSNIDIFDLKDIVWRIGNNTDPKRDSFLSNQTVGIDATRKTKQYDGFERQWPNIIVSDDETIKNVDEKWNELGLGEFIQSPSLKYKNQLYNGGAVAE